MEPWENEEEKALWAGTLVPRGASACQAEVARLVHHGYRNGQIASLQRRSVSGVKDDVRILFAILGVAERDRHAMGRMAQKIVEDAASAPSQTRVLAPELKLVRARRPGSKGRERRGDAQEPPTRQSPNA